MASLWQDFIDAPDYYEESPWFPNPFVCIRDIAISGTKETIHRLPWNGMEQWLNSTGYWLSRSWHHNDVSAVIVPLLIAVVMTLVRIVLNWSLFKRIPKWFELNEDATDKFPESIWKMLYYGSAWVWGVYLVYSGKVNIFFDLRSHWESWSPTTVVEPGIYWLYMTQMAFYLHCVYATLYLETIRKDFAVMMVHHFLTLGLLLFSYVVRFHIIGLLLLIIQDVGDVVLELSKTSFYFKDRGNKRNPFTEILANAFFALFATQHLVCRLYWFPTKVIYSTMHISVLTFPDGPYYLLFNPMLLSLFIMQVYWYSFIVKLLWKILVFGEKVEDTREYEVQKKKKVT